VSEEATILCSLLSPKLRCKWWTEFFVVLKMSEFMKHFCMNLIKITGPIIIVELPAHNQLSTYWTNMGFPADQYLPLLYPMRRNEVLLNRMDVVSVFWPCDWWLNTVVGSWLTESAKCCVVRELLGNDKGYGPDKLQDPVVLNRLFFWRMHVCSTASLLDVNL